MILFRLIVQQLFELEEKHDVQGSITRSGNKVVRSSGRVVKGLVRVGVDAPFQSVIGL